MTVKRALRAAASAGAMAAVCAMAFTSPAWAGTNGISTTDGASARFHHYGDKFEVCDTLKDGAAAYVDYFWTSDLTTEHRDTNPGNSGSCHTFDHNFPENDAVSFRACEDQPFYPDDCAPWVIRYA